MFIKNWIYLLKINTKELILAKRLEKLSNKEIKLTDEANKIKDECTSLTKEINIKWLEVPDEEIAELVCKRDDLRMEYSKLDKLIEDIKYQMDEIKESMEFYRIFNYKR